MSLAICDSHLPLDTREHIPHSRWPTRLPTAEGGKAELTNHQFVAVVVFVIIVIFLGLSVLFSVQILQILKWWNFSFLSCKFCL